MTEREFNDAMDRHLDMVYRLALNWFRQPADAEDAAQEAMLRLWRAGETFTSDDHLRHWLVRVTLNVCKDISRSPWRRRTVPLESVPPAGVRCAGEPGAIPGGDGPAGKIPPAAVPLLF